MKSCFLRRREALPRVNDRMVPGLRGLGSRQRRYLASTQDVATGTTERHAIFHITGDRAGEPGASAR